MRQTEPVSFFEPPPPPDLPEPPFEMPEPEPWWSAPRNELGAPVPLRLVLGRTDQVAIAVVGVTAFSTGVTLTLAIRSRSLRGDENLDPEPAVFPFGHPAMRRQLAGELPPELLRFGVQFADGSKATTVDGGRWGPGVAPGKSAPAGPILSSSGGGGGEGEWDADYWLWPLPPPGTLTFAVEWPSKGIELTMQEVDAGPILEAAATSEALWPSDSGVDMRMSSFHGTIVLGGVSHEDPPEDEKPA